MQTIRQRMNGDFSEKVRQLNDLTKVLVAKQAVPDKPEILHRRGPGKWMQVVKWCLFAFLFMILGHAILSMVPLRDITSYVKTLPREEINGFSLMYFPAACRDIAIIALATSIKSFSRCW